MECSLQCNHFSIPCRMIPFRKAYCMKWTMKRKLCLLKALVKISCACSSFYCHYAIILWILPTKRHKIKWLLYSTFTTNMACDGECRRQTAKTKSYSIAQWTWFQLNCDSNLIDFCIVGGRFQLTCNYFITVISIMKTSAPNESDSFLHFQLSSTCCAFRANKYKHE